MTIEHKTNRWSKFFYEKFLVWKSCHFGRHFKKRSKQTDRCIARTNRYRALHESAFLVQLTPDLLYRISVIRSAEKYLPNYLKSPQNSSLLTLITLNSAFKHIGFIRIRIRIRFFLLMIRLMTFIQQDLWYGKLVPGSRQRCKPTHTILALARDVNLLTLSPASSTEVIIEIRRALQSLVIWGKNEPL